MATTGRESGPFDVVIEIVSAARRSLLVAMAAFGLLLIFIGMIILNGIYAGLFGIWGTLLILVAVIGIAGLELLKRL
ncbi:hypothetical protein NKF26_22575 [Haladaptatus sp. AB618]|nr:hypothetical protein [Haladaptatus sp. AB618]MCO8256607.1 hypothetical protein [Haladaptatus sp. AB618]